MILITFHDVIIILKIEFKTDTYLVFKLKKEVDKGKLISKMDFLFLGRQL